MNLTLPSRRRVRLIVPGPGDIVTPTAPGAMAPAPHPTSFAHAGPPVLPQGLPVRDEELAWADEAVSQMGPVLDAGNPFVLDAEIAWRRSQWDAAVEAAARQWRRAGHEYVAATESQLATQLTEVAGLRRRIEHLETEDRHWRGILLGEPVTPLPRPAPFDPDLVGRPLTHGMSVVDISAALEPAATPEPEDQPESESHVQ